jgi:hypothetical protein
MKVIINRMRWLSAGIALTFMLISWLEDDSEDDNKKVDPYNFNDYKHNHQKAETNA